MRSFVPGRLLGWQYDAMGPRLKRKQRCLWLVQMACGAPCHAMFSALLSCGNSNQCKHRLHFAHTMFNTLAATRSRHDYEALRASYNSARLAGSLPAPPFEEWRGISDVCDRAGCRYRGSLSFKMFPTFATSPIDCCCASRAGLLTKTV